MMGQKNLTPRQLEVFEFIQEYLIDKGIPPTQKEIAEKLRLKGIYGVRQHLRLMAKKGAIHLDPHKARGIRLSSSFSPSFDQRVRKIPLLGRIAAGKPVLAVEEAEEFISVGTGVFRGQDLFALRVQGDSMVNAGINAGDIAIINHQPEVQNGEIAAVILGDEATLKRVILDQDRMLLKAENDIYQDIIVSADPHRRPRIAGKFVGLIRQEPRPFSRLNRLP